MKFYIKKALDFITTLFLISLLTFFVFQLLPGNPALAILGPEADSAQVQALESKMGLNKSIGQRYLSWIGGAIRGDLGVSYQYNQSVSKLIGGSFSVTLSLALVTLIFTVFIGYFFGFFYAYIRKSALCKPLMSIQQIWFSVPSFCTALLLILVFSVNLGLFPTMGYVPISEDFFSWLHSLALPALSLALGSGAILARYTTTSILGEAKQDYVRTARSKGLSEALVIRRHILRNALLPSVTTLGLIMVEILGGSIIIENVFSLPGIGRLIASSIQTRDFPLIQGLVLYLALITLFCNLAVDFLYSLIDPRISLRIHREENPQGAGA
ncbi:ABC transporter permease [Treponema sp. UBA3813]|uniref:ABC transporter permease n=1 Tax=Treponema sp. UBA3813 TaxID=1947715 RepID=UPI0025FD2696|nr:ABC transporter permease [Treponema sp. UBA3813]